MTFIEVGVDRFQIKKQKRKFTSPQTNLLILANWYIKYTSVVWCFRQILYKIKTGIHKIFIENIACPANIVDNAYAHIQNLQELRGLEKSGTCICNIL